MVTPGVIWFYAALVILIALLSIYEIVKSIREYKAAPSGSKKASIFIKLIIFIAAIIVLYYILSGAVIKTITQPPPQLPE
jgi:hypothetical protein